MLNFTLEKAIGHALLAIDYLQDGQVNDAEDQLRRAIILLWNAQLPAGGGSRREKPLFEEGR